jgi:cytochrome c oxidase subunit IV
MDTLHQPAANEIDPTHDHVDEHVAHTHVTPIWLLLAVFGVLLVLTVLTVAVTYVDFGRTINVWVALGIAVIKAGVVALYFMHLRWDSPFNGLVCVTAIMFVAIFIGITVLDTREYNQNFMPPPVTAARPSAH